MHSWIRKILTCNIPLFKQEVHRSSMMVHLQLIGRNKSVTRNSGLPCHLRMPLTRIILPINYFKLLEQREYITYTWERDRFLFYDSTLLNATNTTPCALTFRLDHELHYPKKRQDFIVSADKVFTSKLSAKFHRTITIGLFNILW